MDIRTVIKGLETCINRVPGEYTCDKCPYETHGNDCDVDLSRDALALLKEQQELMFGMIANSNAKCTEHAIHFRRLVLCKDCKHGHQLSADYVSCEISEENESGCHVSHKPDWFCADGERSVN